MNRFLRFSSESVYGTHDTTPAVSFYDPQDGNNVFKPATSRPMWTIRDPKSNVPRVRGSEVEAVTAKWTGRLYWDTYQLALWPLRCSGGPPSTAPWPTDQRTGDLASATIDFGYAYYDLSIKRMRYLGCKVGGNWELSFSADPTNPFVNFSYDVVGATSLPSPITAGTALDATAFPEPAYADLPIMPLTFFQSVLISMGSPKPFFDQFTIRGQQIQKGYYDSFRHVNRVSHNGRTVTLSARLRLDAANDPRTRYEAITALATTTVVFTKPGAVNTLTLNFRSKSYLDNLDEAMIMDDDSYTTLSATAFLDSSTGDDFTISYT